MILIWIKVEVLLWMSWLLCCLKLIFLFKRNFCKLFLRDLIRIKMGVLSLRNLFNLLLMLLIVEQKKKGK